MVKYFGQREAASEPPRWCRIREARGGAEAAPYRRS